jgi:transcriptional regulatory protein RtcR
MSRPTVVLGLLGTTLDAIKGPERWDRWRPTVSLCQQEDLVVSRLELLYPGGSESLCHRIVEDIKAVSPETVVRTHRTVVEDPWDFEGVYASLDEFARGYEFKPEQEDYLVHITTGTHVAQICLFLLTESRRFPARLVQTGPRTKTTNPAGVVRIIDLDLSRYDDIAARFAREHREAVVGLKSGIATRSPSFNRLIEEIEHVATHSSDPILLMGPTGAGKSQLAKRICELKRQRHLISGPFVEVNCATLRGDAAMSTLFGHRKGAFTGASTDRPGLLRSADGGILFLDEIGELGLDEQAMLLRALEEKRFLPLGSDKEVSSKFLLIAGTNRDLAARVGEGRFRGDLLARINLDYELEQFAARSNRIVRFNREARDAFLAFACEPSARWAGNFRDLSASVTRMATLSRGGRIAVADVERETDRLSRSWGADEPGHPGSPSIDAVLASVVGAKRLDDIDLFDRIQLAEVIRICRESATLSEAGRVLFDVSRTKRASINDADRLRKYLERFGLDWTSVRKGQTR